MRKFSLFMVCVFAFHIVMIAQSSHPRLLVSNEDRAVILRKIKQEDWAKKSWESLKSSIDPYVNRHQTDPRWIISRMAMYWKEGEHFTQCYIKNEHWDCGKGNAPVPTVRLPGMRVWNDYANVPLEDRIPYNETGDMKAYSRSNPTAPPVIVPYKESGHLIRGNNTEILSLAEKSAFVYWLTGEEKYAKFSSDIFYTWLLGVYYMNPPRDTVKNQGGYAPGGIMGYYDYECIHDDTQFFAAGAYDFLYSYLLSHPNAHLQNINRNMRDVAGEVFKRFINIGLVRGSKQGNWNVNGFDMILRSMLVLEDDSCYADRQGRQFYIPFYTKTSTKYHDALPDILEVYDKITGLWPESPGYASGTIGSVLKMALPLYKAGVNTIQENPTIQKAALANLAWTDARNNLVVLGDMRGGSIDFKVFEHLLTYYTWQNDKKNAETAASVLFKGLESGEYNRDKSDWTGICLNVPIPETHTEVPFYQSAYSEAHRHLIMKNGNDPENGMMFTLYGGTKGRHLSPNGLAMQFYGKGWAVAPDASAYESYWSEDHTYHQSSTGVNTIIPGYTEGPVTINALDPAIDSGEFTNSNVTSPYCSFADMSAGEKRRVVAMIRTSPSTGYYVDIFRSDLPDNDYLHHNLGNQVKLSDFSGKELTLYPTSDLGTAYSKNYSFFEKQRKAEFAKDFKATWIISSFSPALCTQMWMTGQNNRQLYLADAPPTTLITGITPGNVNKSPEKTPVLIVRQVKNNAAANPFVAVFETFNEGKQSVSNVTSLTSGRKICLLVQSAELHNRKEYIFNAVCDSAFSPAKEITFHGTLGVACENENGFQYLYLGKGKQIKMGDFQMEAVRDEVSANLILKDGKYYYSSDKPVRIAIKKGKMREYPAGYQVEVK